MLGLVRVEDGGDTDLVPDSGVAKAELRGRNRELDGCVRVEDPGHTVFRRGDVVPCADFDCEQGRVAQVGGRRARGARPVPASSRPVLRGITATAARSGSFLRAIGTRRAGRELIRAAVRGAVDPLGPQEALLLGRLLPTGTGFATDRRAEVRTRTGTVASRDERDPGPGRGHGVGA
jgi:hypothetical protein